MKITVRANGPLRVEGENLQISDETGTTFGLAGRTVVSLCRCGASENKPFCAGSHNRIGFLHDGTARDLPAPKPKV